jgi:hypothetical protein
MIEIELAEGPDSSVPLDLRLVRGVGGLPMRLENLVVVGQPQTARLTPERTKDDPDLTRFIEAEANRSHYHLVAFSCTFAPTDAHRIAAAWVQVGLANIDAPDAQPPVATSLEPTKLEQIRPISVTAKIVIPCVFTTELGVSSTKEFRQVVLEARYEGTSKPAWHFTDSRQAAIRGLQRLRLIVRAPASVNTIGHLSVGVTIQHQRFGARAFSYRSRTQDEGPGPMFILEHGGTD